MQTRRSNNTLVDRCELRWAMAGSVSVQTRFNAVHNAVTLWEGIDNKRASCAGSGHCETWMFQSIKLASFVQLARYWPQVNLWFSLQDHVVPTRCFVRGRHAIVNHFRVVVAPRVVTLQVCVLCNRRNRIAARIAQSGTPVKGSSQVLWSFTEASET